ncbi:MAG TPA: hypothetical protein VN325_15485 [Steroidobacteraceae bacterium]|nr:hypothetical protein [Steroidobacteraceae bacterium]
MPHIDLDRKFFKPDADTSEWNIELAGRWGDRIGWNELIQVDLDRGRLGMANFGTARRR